MIEDFKFIKYGSISYGTRESSEGKLIQISALIEFLNWLHDNDDINIILQKIEQVKGDLEK